MYPGHAKKVSRNYPVTRTKKDKKEEQNSDVQPENKIKIVVLGDAGVGKTTIINLLANKTDRLKNLKPL